MCSPPPRSSKLFSLLGLEPELDPELELELVELVVVVELVAELLPESTSFVDDCSIANLVVVVVVVVAVAVVPTVKLTVV